MFCRKGYNQRWQLLIFQMYPTGQKKGRYWKQWGRFGNGSSHLHGGQSVSGGIGTVPFVHFDIITICRIKFSNIKLAEVHPCIESCILTAAMKNIRKQMQHNFSKILHFFTSANRHCCQKILVFFLKPLLLLFFYFFQYSILSSGSMFA